MATLPNMGLITPTLGGDDGTWDDKINACFSLIDEHDHTFGKGVAITPAAMDIDENIVMNNHSVTNIETLAFSSNTALTSGARRLFVNAADNELYWRNNAGVNVQLTSDESINTSLVGGILGDYSSVGAALAFDDANKTYTFKDQSSKWARLATGPVRIYEYNTTESVYVEHAVAAALAASYTVTWPAALPSETVAVKMDASGNILVGRTTKTRTVGVADMLPWDIQGAGGIPDTVWRQSNNGLTDGSLMFWELVSGSSTAASLNVPMRFENGQVITDFNVNIKKASDATTTLFFQLRKISSAGVITNIKLASLATNAPGDTTVTPTAFTHTVDTAFSYELVIYTLTLAPSASDRVYSVKLTYTDPF